MSETLYVYRLQGASNELVRRDVAAYTSVGKIRLLNEDCATIKPTCGVHAAGGAIVRTVSIVRAMAEIQPIQRLGLSLCERSPSMRTIAMMDLIVLSSQNLIGRWGGRSWLIPFDRLTTTLGVILHHGRSEDSQGVKIGALQATCIICRVALAWFAAPEPTG